MKFDLNIIKPLLIDQGGQIQAQYDQLKLRSVFQPILDIHNYEIIGFEGLMRTDKEQVIPISVEKYFQSSRSLLQKVGMDRVLRTIHVANFIKQANSHHKLFLNICPSVIVDGYKFGAFFKAMLQEFRIAPERVVIEIVEKEIYDEESLSNAVSYYRDMGCQIAIDDFGKGYSNLSRIWSIQPDIVKLDRHLLHFAQQQNNAVAMLQGVVDMLHDSDCRVIAEGVENRQQADLAYSAGIDMVQGYYFQEPLEVISTEYQSQMMNALSG